MTRVSLPIHDETERMIEGRRVVLNYPPASSVWHLPAGIASLAAVLTANGHDVSQRYGHILGLEHLLRRHGGERASRAIQAIRNPQSGIGDLYDARQTLASVSRKIQTPDRFAVLRNNILYIAATYDGTIEGVLDAVRQRDRNLWYDYFRTTELPYAFAEGPDMYAISISDERQLVAGCILAAVIKEALPTTLVVLGGNLWSRLKHAFEISAFRKFFDFCDAIVYGEGYQPMLQLASSLNPSRTSGTVWLDTDRVRINPLMTSPMPFEELPTPVYQGGATPWSPDVVYPLHTMSNCEKRCGFCAISAGSDTYLATPRAMSPRRIAEHMLSLGGNRFDIVDEMFSLERQLALGEELQRIEYSATWQCYMIVDPRLADSRVCERLYAAGCRGVQLGLESLSTATLKREHKGWNKPALYGRILRNLCDAGIQTHVFLIVGLPGEPLHGSFRWLDFIEKYGDAILTIKSGRYRLTRESPEARTGSHGTFIEIVPDTKPLHLNRDFRYSNTSRNKIEAMRDLLEQACRTHWAYAVTSTLPWWINRGRYSLQELRTMTRELPKEEDVPHLDRVLRKMNGILHDELGRDVRLETYEEAVRLSRAI